MFIGQAGHLLSIDGEGEESPEKNRAVVWG